MWYFMRIVSNAMIKEGAKGGSKVKDLKERIRMVRAMETLARSINNEAMFMPWIVYGVADGDITDETRDEELLSYCEDDEVYGELMGLFLRRMCAAYKSGGLYSNGVTSKK